MPEPDRRPKSRAADPQTIATDPQPRAAEQGAVTAETAMALPLVAAFAVTMAWLVALGITQVRALDAARETARSAARSDGQGEAVALGRRVAPAGSRVVVRRSDGTVVVRVTSPVRGAGLLGRWSRFEVHAEAVAAEEPGQAGTGTGP